MSTQFPSATAPNGASSVSQRTQGRVATTLNLSTRKLATLFEGLRMDVAADGKAAGGIKRTWGVYSFEYQDAAGKTLASSEGSALSVGRNMTVKDAQGRPLASIEQDVAKTLKNVPLTFFRVLDAGGRPIASIDQTSLMPPRYEVRRPNGQVVATLSRSGFVFDWKVTVTDAGAVDPKVLALFAALRSVK